MLPRKDSATSTSRYFPRLDPVRFILATLVLVFHYFYWGPRLGLKGPGASQHWLLVLAFSVQFFFTISGFVIIQSAKGRTWQAFLLARTKRLWPALLVCATLTFMVVTFTRVRFPGAETASLSNLVKSTALWPLLKGGGIDWSYWSLTIELRFYVIVAIVLALRLQPQTLRQLALAYVAIRLGSEHFPSRFATIFQTYDPLRHYGGFFALGAFWADLTISYKSNHVKRFQIVALLLCMGLATLQFRSDFLRLSPSGWNSHLSLVVGVFATIALTSMLIFCTSGSTNRGSRFLLVLGSVSYPLYLLHQFVGYILIRVIRHFISKPFAAEVLAALLVLMAALLSDRIVIPRVTKLYDGLIKSLKRRDRDQAIVKS